MSRLFYFFLFIFPFLFSSRAASAEQVIRVGVVVKQPEKSVRVDTKKGLVNGRRYRGSLRVVPAGAGKVTVINVLPLEEYLRGVVASEMPPSWPQEALRAQAVVARSYAVANLGRFGKDGYDICATASCQVYQGVRGEKPSTDAAVKATRGKALLHKGKPISAVFHSACGGRTDDASDVWRSDGFPYLKGVRSRWCGRECPHNQWKVEIPDKDFASRLRGAGHDVGKVKSVKILSRTAAGRAHGVRVKGSKKSVDLKANDFRLIVGPKVIRSTLWSGVSHGGGAWRFHGRGWGHGVGLCQWCAKVMAGEGRRHKDILSHFYRGAKLKEL